MENITNTGSGTPQMSDVADLISFALEVLPSTRGASGLYCFDRAFGRGELQGESVRYSLMVLLGLLRAESAGYDTQTDTRELLDLCLARTSTYTPGDLGLALWADARADGAAIPELLLRLSVVVPDDEALEPLAGMEIAWLLIGLAHAIDRSPAAAAPLATVMEHLRHKRRAPSGLYYHDARSRLRRRLPNFATEIYTLLALAVLGHRGLDAGATPMAEQLADHLLRLQLSDGGWPWLFDADRGVVVERYEIYSVHQDAMAPMALLQLTELTGDGRYAAAAVRGLAWSRGANELHIGMHDRGVGFAHRSIRRRSPWDRFALATNSLATLSTGRPARLGSGHVELNATCRPYHLGWILEAWAGREALVSDHG